MLIAVKTIELSNHPDAMYRAERDRLEDERRQHREAGERQLAQKNGEIERANNQAEVEHQAALRQHAAEVQRLRDERDAETNWWKRLRGRLSVWTAERRTPRPPRPQLLPPPPPPPSDRPFTTNQGAKLAAGMEGEKIVANRLSEIFGDEWTLVQGYRNGHGEVDQLLLGPQGLVAIEVKHRNATVHPKGDVWRFEKFDKYGNQVKDGFITDGRGRSPSRQVNEIAAELEEFLARRGQPIAVGRLVVLSHPRAGLGHYEDLTVNVSTDVDFVVEVVQSLGTRLDPARQETIEQLIVRDHQFHESRRRSR